MAALRCWSDACLTALEQSRGQIVRSAGMQLFHRILLRRRSPGILIEHLPKRNPNATASGSYFRPLRQCVPRASACKAGSLLRANLDPRRYFQQESYHGSPADMPSAGKVARALPKHSRHVAATQQPTMLTIAATQTDGRLKPQL